MGVDWSVDLRRCRTADRGRVALQGNPSIRDAVRVADAIRREVGHALDAYRDGNGGSREGHVFNLGHGMSPDMIPRTSLVLVDAVHRLSAR